MINFFSVCKFDKSAYIHINNFYLNSFYKDFRYFIIIPSFEEKYFKELLIKHNLDSVQLINEEDFISFEEFKGIYSDIANIKKLKKISKFLGWYYQQVLKLSFIFSNPDCTNVMIDADTILLQKINFVRGKRSIVCKSEYEKNLFYKETSFEIFGEIKNPWFSSTVQLFSITKYENQILRKCLKKYLSPKSEKLGEWISKIILNSTIKCRGSIEGSFISEQDLIGTSKLIDGNTNIEKHMFMRSYVTGKLTKNQMRIASILNFKYVTYEKWIMKKNYMNYIEFINALLINYPPIHKTLKIISNLLKSIKTK